MAYDYPKLIGGLDFEVYHVSQLLQKMLGKIKTLFRNDVNMIVTYHDPCDLGRLSEIYNAPRIVLSSIPGIKLIELPKSRSLTRCCGGGGMLKATNSDIALKLAKKALLRPLDVRNKDSTLAEMEEEILGMINHLGIGPMGLGGRTTALTVNIEYTMRHPATFPTAMVIQCWCDRRASIGINKEGEVR